MNTKINQFLLAALTGIIFTAELRAQTSTFTYQGHLADNGLPASGIYDLRFTIYDLDTGGTEVGGPITNTAVTVSNGAFSVTLDFGPGVFDGSQRWLEIAVATNGSEPFEALAPRQFITSVPYAIQAANAANAVAAVSVTGNVSAGQLTGTIAPANIAPGTITTSMIASGAVGTEQLADDAVTADKILTTAEWVFSGSIFNPTPENGDHFGTAVAGVGERMVLIGAYSDNTGADSAGAAYLFTTDGTLLTTFTNPTPEGSDYFASSVAAVGNDQVLIGAPGDNTGAASAGAAYLFSTNGTLLTTITNPTPESSEYFGLAVAAVGTDKVLIGASRDNTGAYFAGAAYLFSTDGTLLTTFTNPTPESYDQFGAAVAVVNEDTVLIGAPGDNTGAGYAGAAYLFSTDGTLLTTITNPTPQNGGEVFGRSMVVVSADTVLIGAPNDHAGFISGVGAAYLFSTNGTLLTTITNPTPEGSDYFASSVAAVGNDQVLIGAPGDDTGAAYAGSAYLFSTDGTLLTTFTNPTPEYNDAFGIAAVGVGADRVLIGADGDNTGANNAGAAYLFSLKSYVPGLVAESVRDGAIATLQLADGAVDSNKLADGAVGTAQLAVGAVTAVAIASNSITAGQLAAGAVGTVQLADGAVTTDKIADVAVTKDKIAAGSVGATELAQGAVGADQMAAGAAAANLANSSQSAVPSGGMILSSNYSDGNLFNAGYVKLGRVDLGDVWEQRAGGPQPGGRADHTAVWTGSEMIVWGGTGGSGYLNDGGRYNPVANSWSAVTTYHAPTSRRWHTAVWTGSEMIVWGGSDGSGYLNDGGRYNPVKDSWSAVNTNGAPVGRIDHTAVWTGSKMIVWGGYYFSSIQHLLNDGGHYNPTTDSWSALASSGAPTARHYHTAVWTGSEMIVWGGYGNSPAYKNDGGRYNDLTQSWSVITTNGAPAARRYHAAVWTGSEMIVWGGQGASGYLDDGGRYNPGDNSWTAMSVNGAPSGRILHTAVWTGSEMIVWGGYDGSNLNDGGRYNPTANSWPAMTTSSTPSARSRHTAVWTGSEMIVWGGNGAGNFLNDGGRYSPAANSWTAMSANGAPPERMDHKAVWTGSQMIIWGGYGNGGLLWKNDGKRYNPVWDNWTTMSTNGAPSVRMFPTTVWTGSEMIVWGGRGVDGNLNDGGRYDPMANTWSAVSTNGAPSARENHTAVWTGSEMIVWGGSYYDGSFHDLNTGGRFDPVANSWSAVTTYHAPTSRRWHTAVWTGSEMIVWGGSGGSGYLNDGGRYNPVKDSWSAVNTNGAPVGRIDHTAVWTGSEMIVWGGYDGSNLNDGGRYNPVANSWSAVTTDNAPTPRQWHTAVWTDSEMIVWGGYGVGRLNDTFSYVPSRVLYLYQKP